MKRLFVLLLALVSLLSLALTGCGKREEGAKENVDGRYYLYAADNKLYCLDAKDGKTRQIETGTDVCSVTEAMVSEANGRMLLKITTGPEKEGETTPEALLLWDGKSQSAELVETNAELARVNKEMDSVVYAKGQQIYQYRIGSGSKLIFDDFNQVAVSEDLSGMLAMVVPKEFAESVKSGDYVEEWALEYSNGKAEPERIAKISNNACRPAASSDLSVVCYTKGPSGTSLFRAYPVFMWTPKGGERELPFEAIALSVQSETEIYYLSGMENDKISLYYYDGKESHLLHGNVASHIHKVSDQLTCCVCLTESSRETLVIHKGKTVQIPGRICHLRNVLGSVSDDGKTVFIHDEEETWYKAELQDTGELTGGAYIQGPEYRPRYDTFKYDQMVILREETLYCNGQAVEKDVAGYKIWPGGRLCYKKDGSLYLWENGKSVKLAEIGEAVNVGGFENSLVMTEADSLYLLKGSEKKLIAEAVQDVILAEEWGSFELGNVTIGGVRTGWWYESPTYDYLTAY